MGGGGEGCNYIYIYVGPYEIRFHFSQILLNFFPFQFFYIPFFPFSFYGLLFNDQIKLNLSKSLSN